MEFKIRKNQKYFDVSVRVGSMVVDLGLLDDTERASLVRVLEEAIEELTEGTNYRREA